MQHGTEHDILDILKLRHFYSNDNHIFSTWQKYISYWQMFITEATQDHISETKGFAPEALKQNLLSSELSGMFQF